MAAAEPAVREPKWPNEREVSPEFLVHALAQLPDEVTLDVAVSRKERRRLELLVAAYGIEERMTFHTDSDKRDRPLSEVPEVRTMAELVGALTSAHAAPAATYRNKDGIFAGERIGVVTNVPAHYRVPLFNCVSRRLAMGGADFRVFFLAQSPTSRPWMTAETATFDHEFLHSLDLRRDRGRQLFPFDLERKLAQFDPTVLLAAGFSPGVSMRIARYANHREQTVFGLWSGEIAARPTAESRLRRIQRSWLVRRASFAIAYGERSAEYLHDLRADLPVVIGRNTTPVRAARARRPHPEVVELLIVSRVERGKEIACAIDAVLALPDLPCRLTVVGDGSELTSLQAKAGRDDRIRFIGALPSDQINRAYRDADVFLFPSGIDIFGLVLVEAMGSGLATIASTRPGAVADLALDGQNCLLVEGHRPEAWAEIIKRVVLDHELRLSLGENAKRTVRNRWTIEHACDAMIAGFRLGLLCRTRR